MSNTYYVNAKKLVDLVQLEIEADSEEEAINQYLHMALKGEVEVSDYNWWALSAGDIEAEKH